MAIIINKPTIEQGAPPESVAIYNADLALYNSYLDAIRQSVWADLTAEDISDSEIDNVVILGAAEREIISKYGTTLRNRAAFTALNDTDKAKLIEGTILQSALFLLPRVPQLKRTAIEQTQYEYFQVTDREKELQSRLTLIFPDAETPTGPNALFPTGGGTINWDVAPLGGA